jgi:uncharacterized phage protein (TIGR02218 family)
MRQLDPQFLLRLQSGVTSICKCWQITSINGDKICITEHDEDVVFNNEKYQKTALNNQSIDKATNQINRTNFSGVFDIDAINADKIKLGHFKNAMVKLFIVDWQMPQYFCQYFCGFIGDINYNNQEFEFEIIGVESLLNQNIGRKFGKMCDANLGDGNCKLNLIDFQKNGQIIDYISKSKLQISILGSIDLGIYANAIIEFTNGNLKGQKFEFAKLNQINSNFEIELIDVLPIAPRNDDEIIIYPICDKTISKCGQIFNNAKNFRGCPYMPGESIIYASP